MKASAKNDNSVAGIMNQYSSGFSGWYRFLRNDDAFRQGHHFHSFIQFGAPGDPGPCTLRLQMVHPMNHEGRSGFSR